MTNPITPQEAKESAASTIPQCIIEAVNKLLSQNIGNNKSIKILQDDILEEAGAGKENKAFRQQIFDKGWLNIENLYAKFGWHVTYDKPAYCETYPASFTFKIV